MASIRPIITTAIILAVAVLGFFFWQSNRPDEIAEGCARGNGRIEAVEIDVAARLSGRIEAVLVDEGAIVAEGDPLVRLDARQLMASRHQLEVELRRAEIGVENATLLVEQREAEVRAA